MIYSCIGTIYVKERDVVHSLHIGSACSDILSCCVNQSGVNMSKFNITLLIQKVQNALRFYTGMATFT